MGDKKARVWHILWPFGLKDRKKKGIFREWADALVFAAIAAFFIRTFLLEAFFIPTASMERSLLVGDLLFVSKVHYGARLPMTPFALPFVHNSIPFTGIKSYIPGFQLPYARLWGVQDIERGEPVVFNFPAHDIQPLDQRLGTVDIPTLKENYIKRCVGIPGDVLHIKNAQLYVNGRPALNPPDMQHRYIIYAKPNQSLKNCEAEFLELGFRRPVAHANRALIQEEGGQNANLYLVGADAGNPYSDTFVVDSLNRALWVTSMPDHLVEQVKALNCVADVKKAPFNVHEHYGVKNPPQFVLDNEAYTLDALRQQHLVHYPKNYRDGNFVTHPELIPFKDWNLDNMGPFRVPKKGMSLRITPQNLPLYSRVIEVYEDAGTTRIAGNQVYLDDKPLNEYTFEMDYYWMMGDNRHNSEDSRYWGFVPEDHIVGKPLFVLISIEGGVRWSRIFMGID